MRECLSRSATPQNKYSWNGKERQDEFGLNWHDHGWRFYDPALGRWVVTDPDGEKGDQEGWTSYQFGLDNAVRYNDLDRRMAGEGSGKGLRSGVADGSVGTFTGTRDWAVASVQSPGAFADVAGIATVGTPQSWRWKQNQVPSAGYMAARVLSREASTEAV